MAQPREISANAQFEILAPLSIGGMGSVHLARRLGAHGFQKLMALKTIRPDLLRHEEMKKMFLDEAKLLARLDHPAVAQVYDFVEQGQLYLSMEYVSGVPLNALMSKRKAPLPPAIVARIAVEVCRGLHAAHELTDFEGRPLGVVHRDISPQNLMLTFDGRIKILDFGVAYMLDREATATQTGMFKGKLAYVAPEQLSGRKADRRSDLYSLGVVMHELLTARRLFSRGRDGLVDAVHRKAVPKPSAVAPFRVPKELDEIVMKALEPKPSARFSDAKEMAQALEDYLHTVSGESLEAFAQRELAQEREKHRSWLQQLMEAPTVPAARPNDEPARDPSEPGQPQDERSVEIPLDSLFDEAPPPPQRTAWFLAIVLILAAFALGAWLLFPAVIEDNVILVVRWVLERTASD